MLLVALPMLGRCKPFSYESLNFPKSARRTVAEAYSSFNMHRGDMELLSQPGRGRSSDTVTVLVGYIV